MRVAKMCLAAAAAAVVLTAVAVLPKRLCFRMGTQYTFYLGTSSADCREVTVTDNAALARLCLSDICGESTTYESLDVDAFLRDVDGKIVFAEELSDSVNYYCTANLPYSVNLYGTQINLHICVRDGAAKVASPIIFGGY